MLTGRHTQGELARQVVRCHVPIEIGRDQLHRRVHVHLGLIVLRDGRLGRAGARGRGCYQMTRPAGEREIVCATSRESSELIYLTNYRTPYGYSDLPNSAKTRLDCLREARRVLQIAVQRPC